MSFSDLVCGISLVTTLLASASTRAAPPDPLADLFRDDAFISGCLGKGGALVSLYVDDKYADMHAELLRQIGDNLDSTGAASRTQLHVLADDGVSPKCGNTAAPLTSDDSQPQISIYLKLYQQDHPGTFSHARLVIRRGDTCHSVDLEPGREPDTCGVARRTRHPGGSTRAQGSERPEPEPTSTPDIPIEEPLTTRLTAPWRFSIRGTPLVMFSNGERPIPGIALDLEVGREAIPGLSAGIQILSWAMKGDGVPVSVFVGNIGYSWRYGALALVGGVLSDPFPVGGVRARIGRLDDFHLLLFVYFPGYIRMDLRVRIPGDSLWLALQYEAAIFNIGALTAGPRFALVPKTTRGLHFLHVSAGIGHEGVTSIGLAFNVGYEVRFGKPSRRASRAKG